MLARILGPYRYVLYLALFIYTFVQIKLAHALDIDKPSVMEGGADTSKVDAATTSLVEMGLYIAYSMGAVGVVIGLALCVPLVGKQDKGITTVKGSIVVIILVGLTHALLSFVGGLT